MACSCTGLSRAYPPEDMHTELMLVHPQTAIEGCDTARVHEAIAQSSQCTQPTRGAMKCFFAHIDGICPCSNAGRCFAHRGIILTGLHFKAATTSVLARCAQNEHVLQRQRSQCALEYCSSQNASHCVVVISFLSNGVHCWPSLGLMASGSFTNVAELVKG
eukprot:4523040-Pleurochrysis_carterae.AAC.1